MTGAFSALSNFAQDREDVPLPGGAVLSVRALTVGDIADLLRVHALDLVDPLRNFRADPFGAISALVDAGPRVVAHIIALAADAPGAIEAARRLPIGAALKVLFAVDRLTFGASGERQSFADMLGPILGQHFPAVH